MEVILITPNPKYQTLISANRTIQSPTVDLSALVEQQLTINHHKEICIYGIKNNLPYQYRQPVKIAKELLKKSIEVKQSEHFVQLTINGTFSIKIQAQTVYSDTITTIQQYVRQKLLQEEPTIAFVIKFEQYLINYTLLNQQHQPQEQKVKQTITALHIKSSASIQHTVAPPQEIRLIIFIDQSNYQEFLSWTENQGDFYDFQLNEKLHKEYMKLKQQIDNEKNSFRNKIKMVETILGQNINIDKLLAEEKDQNSEYKRLRETFETIKNIGNVIGQQQKKIQSRTTQLKQKRAQKHRIHYENAKLFAKKKAEIMTLQKQLTQSKYKVNCVKSNKKQFEKCRNFQISAQVRKIMEAEHNKYKGILQNVNSYPVTSNTTKSVNNSIALKKSRKLSKVNDENIQITTKSRIFQSLYKQQKKQRERYQSILRQKVNQVTIEQQQNSKQQKTKMYEQMKVYEGILKNIANYYEKNHSLLLQIRNKIEGENKFNKTAGSKSLSSSICLLTNVNQNKIKWSEQQFYVLNQLLQVNCLQQFNFDPLTSINSSSIQNIDNIDETKNGSNISINNKYASSCTIDEQKDSKKDKQFELNNNASIIYGRNSVVQKTKNNSLSPANTNNKLTKTKVKPVFATSSHTNSSNSNLNNNYDIKVQNKNILNQKKIIKFTK